jgi:hypothetical protein
MGTSAITPEEIIANTAAVSLFLLHMIVSLKMILKKWPYTYRRTKCIIYMIIDTVRNLFRFTPKVNTLYMPAVSGGAWQAVSVTADCANGDMHPLIAQLIRRALIGLVQAGLWPAGANKSPPSRNGRLSRRPLWCRRPLHPGFGHP